MFDRATEPTGIPGEFRQQKPAYRMLGEKGPNGCRRRASLREDAQLFGQLAQIKTFIGHSLPGELVGQPVTKLLLDNQIVANAFVGRLKLLVVVLLDLVQKNTLRRAIGCSGEAVTV